MTYAYQDTAFPDGTGPVMVIVEVVPLVTTLADADATVSPHRFR